MKRKPLYSRSRPHAIAQGGRGGVEEEPGEAAGSGSGGRGEASRGEERPSRGLRRFARRHERAFLVAGGALVVLAAFLLHDALRPVPAPLTQREIDLAVLHTLENQPRPPSVESLAYAVVQPSVVRVQRLRAEVDPDLAEPDAEAGPGEIEGLGTGVVVVDDGTILTNLHVVAGVDRIQVIFADGTESPADVIGVRPEHDLAVIRARILPDDLIPATLRSTRDVHVGDRVIAVGFPFGIGPSLTSGVVSGLRREYRTQEGERVLSDLIQFDAAANPGNSGGPLVTEDGQVVGIVTAILNPNNQRSFVGIAFAVPIESAMEAVGSSPF
jgi:S1-C subfamily serine protease